MAEWSSLKVNLKVCTKVDSSYHLMCSVLNEAVTTAKEFMTCVKSCHWHKVYVERQPWGVLGHRAVERAVAAETTPYLFAEYIESVL